MMDKEGGRQDAKIKAVMVRALKKQLPGIVDEVRQCKATDTLGTSGSKGGGY